MENIRLRFSSPLHPSACCYCNNIEYVPLGHNILKLISYMYIYALCNVRYRAQAYQWVSVCAIVEMKFIFLTTICMWVCVCDHALHFIARRLICVYGLVACASIYKVSQSMSMLLLNVIKTISILSGNSFNSKFIEAIWALRIAVLICSKLIIHIRL